MGVHENQLSRWGAISKVLPDLAPAANVYFVGDTDDTGFVDFVNEFPPDAEGRVRIYSSVFDSTMVANLRVSRGDVVLAMPGHQESITADQSLSIAGVKYLGLGEGDLRPLIQYDLAAASISLDAAGVIFDNFRLLASVTAVTIGVDIAGAGCVVRNNEMRFDATADDFAISIRATGDRPIINHNRLLGEDTVGPTDGIQLSSAAFAQVKDNYVTGQFSNAAISDTLNASLSVEIGRNYVNNQDTASALLISMLATSTGLIYKNMLASSDTAAAIAGQVSEGACKWIENYVVNDTAETGAVIPASASG